MAATQGYLSNTRSQLLLGRDVARLVGRLSDSNPPEPRVLGALATILFNQHKMIADQEKSWAP